MHTVSDTTMKTTMLMLLLMVILAPTRLGAAPPQQPADKECDNVSKKCPWKLWSHYVERGCQPQYDSDPCCPSRFKCPDRNIYKDDSMCHFGARSYRTGSSVNQTDTCRKCYCRENNADLVPQIECMHSECPEHLLPPEPYCTLLYDTTKDCCSTHSYCPTDEFSDKGPEVTCQFANKTYIKGERIEFDYDLCVFCVCDKGFNGPEGPGCRRIDYCYLDSQEKIGKGCVPVFNVDTCCPTDWICPEIDTLPLIYNEQNCIFDGRSYPPGTKLPTNLDCVECRCKTPPDFTCVQTRCYKK